MATPPPRDPRMPEFPYHPGFSTTIRRHQPGLPFGVSYSKESFRESKLRDSTTQLEWCLQFPASDSLVSSPSDWARIAYPEVDEDALHRPETPPELPVASSDSWTHKMCILDAIASGEERGAQVMRVCIDDAESRSFVAKIFDPLYFSPEADITYWAERGYRCEANAYKTIRKAGLDGSFSPRYFGSWTFDIPMPTGDEATVPREVHMLLMEWLDGSTMKALNDTGVVYSIDIKQRLTLVEQAMEAVCELERIGIEHNDFWPRNVIVTGLSTATPRVYLIDFNLAIDRSYPFNRWYEYWRKEPINPLPRSPMSLFRNHTMSQFEAWMPKNYSGQRSQSVANAWRAHRWGGSPKFRPIDELDEEYLNKYPVVDYEEPVPQTPPGKFEES